MALARFNGGVAIIVAMVAGALAGCSCSDVEIIGAAETACRTFVDAIAEPGPGCGNGIVEVAEECDDGNSDDCDGCSNACRRERAMRVTGVSRGMVVEGDEAPCSTGELTVEMWFRLDPAATDTNCYLFNGASNFNASFGDRESRTFYGHSIFFSVQAGGLDVYLEPATWHHYAVVVSYQPDGGHWDYSWFLDGDSHRMGTCYAACPVLGCLEPFLVGAASDDWPVAGPCQVTIDDVRVSCEALYSGDFTPETRLEVKSNTLALWDFDLDDHDAVIPDSSGNRHDGILVDGTLVPDDCHSP